MAVGIYANRSKSCSKKEAEVGLAQFNATFSAKSREMRMNRPCGFGFAKAYEQCRSKELLFHLFLSIAATGSVELRHTSPCQKDTFR